MIHFEWPWLFLLVSVPWLVRYLLPAISSHQDAALRIPFIEDYRHLAHHSSRVASRHSLMVWVAFIAWLLLVLAVTRPQWIGDPIELPVSGRDLMLAVDLSGSMEVEDFNHRGRSINRLEATQMIAGDFIERRIGDRIGLILFGRQAYLQTPLTFDRETVNTLLAEAVIGMAGKETAIGDAIGLAVKRLRDKEASSRVLILLTDGENTAGEIQPIKAAELAAETGLKIYTIGIGADEMQVRTLFGSRTVNPSATLDEKTLKAIAAKTGGNYYRARDTAGLEKIYSILDELEPVERETQTFRPTTALYYWPLSLAALMSLLVMLFSLYRASRFRNVFESGRQ